MTFVKLPAFIWICAALSSACSAGVATISGAAGHTAAGASAGSAGAHRVAGADAAGRGGDAGAGGVTSGTGGAGGACSVPPCPPGNEVNPASCRCEPVDGSVDAGSDAANGGRGTAGKGGGESCPPECLRAYTCAMSCDATPVNYGCCPCPQGTIDTITCDHTAAGYCSLPCTGAAPDPSVASACQGLKNAAECSAYTSSAFPYHCAWVVPPAAACLVP